MQNASVLKPVGVPDHVREPRPRSGHLRNRLLLSAPASLFVGRWAALSSVALVSAGCSGTIESASESESPSRGAPDEQGGGGANGGDGDSSGPDGSVVKAHFRRLTRAELAGTLAVVLRIDRARAEQALEAVPLDLADASGFVSPRTVNGAYLEQLTAAVGELVAGADLGAVAPVWSRGCADQIETAACVANFVWEVGRRVFRRPLTEKEAQDIVNLVDLFSAESGAEADGALRLALEVMLLRPESLYLWEVPPGQLELPGDLPDKGRVAMSAHEIAARLSFLLWGEPPDEELSSRADSDELLTSSTLNQQIQRLLTDPRSDGLFERFIDTWLDLEKLEDADRKPAGDGADLSDAIRAAMRREVHAVALEIIRKGEGTLAALFTASLAQVDAPLAEHYALPIGSGGAVGAQTEAARQGSGVLGLGGFLVASASHDAPSPTHLGLKVRDTFLCDMLQPPPAGVDTSLPARAPGQTLRSRTEAHIAEPSCSGCHRYMDPIGFAGLAFDHLGRVSQSGEDTTGYILDYEDEDSAEFTDLAGLAQLLAGSRKARVCFARGWMRLVSGVSLGADAPLPSEVTRTFVEDAGRIEALLSDLAQSGFVRFRDAYTVEAL